MSTDFAINLIAPTAAGKTKLALELAQLFPIEIISIDSALVYRDMDIGTAKPSIEERSSVPHHLIDIINVDQAYSVAHCYADVQRLICDIVQRGKMPLCVGGTMMYFKALQAGLSNLPASSPEIKTQVAQQIAEQGLWAIYASLQEVDPQTASKLQAGDQQRISRAWEVYLQTQRSLSDWQSIQTPQQHNIKFYNIGLQVTDRSWLSARIELRLAQMIKQGLIEEVQNLQLAYPQLDINLPAMRSVGYAQALAYLAGEYDKTECQQRILFATRQLAKRQITWMRGSLSFDNQLPAESVKLGELAVLIASFLEKTAL